MKIITQEQLRTQIREQGSKSINGYIDFNKLHETIVSKYGEFDDFHIFRETIAELSLGLDILNGNKKFLDLGCGARKGYDQGLSQETFKGKIDFQPILSRALHELGVKVIGIDYGNLDGEEFEHYSLNLLDENSLSFIPDYSIDIAHSSMLFDSPQLIKLSRCAFEKDTREKLKGVLLPQIERIVKPEGFFYAEEHPPII